MTCFQLFNEKKIRDENFECRVTIEKTAGRPPPSVLWYIDGQLVDETFDLVEGRDVVINKLRYTRYSPLNTMLSETYVQFSS